MDHHRVVRRDARRRARHTELVKAALEVFVTSGVTAASVDDIVRAAGVAKGTFYLYFNTKDDAVNAVAGHIVDGVGDRIEAAATNPNASPVERLLTLGRVLADVGAQPYERDLIEIFHRPENRAVHDRVSAIILARLSPVLTAIIADGIAAGLFRPQDPRLAASFVLGNFTLLHDVVSEAAQMPAAMAQLNIFILRGLGNVSETDE